MFYIIKTVYVGPNQDSEKYEDCDKIEISTCPATTNSSKETCVQGWCGTTQDFSVHAYGAYSTIEQARATIADRFGDMRNCDIDGNDFESDDEAVVEVYKFGKYIKMSSTTTAAWASDLILTDITAHTTDDRIAELVAYYETEANRFGYSLDSDIDDFMIERRKELRDELEEDVEALSDYE